MDFVRGFTIQPSEFSKLAVIIMLSSFASAPDRDLDTKKTFFISLLIILSPLILIILEPDLSSALIVLPATVTILLYAGIQRKLITITSGILVILSILTCLWIKYESPNPKDTNHQK